jgi:tetratricopeptide (TPR) repeat protein
MQSRPEEAVKDFESSLGLRELPPRGRFNYADVHLMLGKVYQEKLHRNAPALHHYKEVLRLDPGHPQRDALEKMIRYLSR